MPRATRPTAEGLVGLELSTGTGLYGACRSTQCCLAVWPRRVELSTRLGGFRALKKTPEAPYTIAITLAVEPLTIHNNHGACSVQPAS